MSEKSRVISEMIYSLNKGIRKVALYTIETEQELEQIKKSNYEYMVQYLSNGYANVFFGDKDCIDVINMICRGRKLNELSVEEDFIIGTILGYDVLVQCKRYKKRKEKPTE